MSKVSRTDWLLCGLVVAVAASLRFYRLGDLPPGLPNDAAINGLDAWRLLHRGGHTVFLTANGGREALFIYLQALSLALFGTTPFALRLPGVLIDTLTAGLLFWFGRWLFGLLPGALPRWGGLGAGLWLAVSPWMLAISRLGFRAVLVPLVATALFWAFLLAWQRHDRRWYGLTGLFLGLTAYTYPAARVLPLVLVITLLTGLIPQNSITRRRLVGLLLTLLMAGLVYTPMLIYTGTHSGQAANRIDSVALWNVVETQVDLAAALLQNVKATAFFFCCRGNEELVLFGLPGQGAHNVGLSLLLALGLGGCLAQWRRIEARLVLGWFFITWLPTLLAIEAPHPLRLIAAAPATALLVGQGTALLIRRWPRAALGVSLWFGVSLILTGRDYFVRWPALNAIPDLFNYETVTQVNAIRTQVDQGNIVYLPQSEYTRPTTHFYLNGPFSPVPDPDFTETAARVLFMGPEDEVAWVRLSPGEARILPARSEKLGPTTGSLAAEFGPLRLTGATFPATIDPATPLAVTLFWEATRPVAENYEILVHLVDDGLRGWSEDLVERRHKAAYPTTYWRPGQDQVPDYHALQLQREMPVGRYRLAISVFDPAQDWRLLLPPTAGKSSNTFFIGPLKIPPPPPATPPDFATEFIFDGVGLLRGYSLESTQLRSGDGLSLDLHWEATAIPRPRLHRLCPSARFGWKSAGGPRCPTPRRQLSHHPLDSRRTHLRPPSDRHDRFATRRLPAGNRLV